MANRNVARWITIALIIPVLAMVITAETSGNFRWIKDKAAPELRFDVDENGKAGKLSDFRGKVVLLNFWASWCGPCMEEMPALKKLEEKFASKGLVVLSVNVEERKEAVAKTIKLSTLPTHSVFEPSQADIATYKVQTIPVSLLIDRKGIVRDGILGGPDWLSTESLKSIEKLLN